MNARLSQRQGAKQAQTLTHSQCLGAKLLAMNLPALRQSLQQEMSVNPAIDDIEHTLENMTVSERERQIENEERPNDYLEDEDYREVAYLEGIVRGKNGSDPEAMERRERFFENRAKEDTLEEHLRLQISISDIDPADRPLAEVLIGNLNERGFFDGSIPDIMMVSGASESKIRQVLAQIGELDPPGCGATTAKECLMPQLDAIRDVAVRERVRKLLDRLEDVSAGKVDDAEALKALRSLNAAPGLAYRHQERGEEYVNPEVHAVKCSDGWIARVDARSQPQIRISSKIMSILEDPNASAETKSYVRAKIAAAKELMQAVADRCEKVEAIAQAIFDAQPGFFEKGLRGLKPLTEQEIANQLGLSASDVSRTVCDKYAATPKGTIELRKFFLAGMTTAGGERVTRDSVLDELKAMIDAEDKARPLSDDELSKRLKAKGYPVERRTAAKYRMLLKIPGKFERKTKTSCPCTREAK